MFEKKYLSALIYPVAFLVFFLLRLPGIGLFTTVDEPDYIKFGGNFYYSLGQREFEKTHQTYQPAVTTNLSSALAYHLIFPEYRGLGQGYFTYTFDQTAYLEEHNQEPMELLILGRIIMVAAVSLFLTISFYLLKVLFGLLPATITILIISFEPYFLGHSRLLTQEGLMSASVMVSILGMLVFSYRKKHWAFFGLSAFSGAVAFLTKITAIAAFPVPFILIIIMKAAKNNQSYFYRIIKKISWVLVWFFIFAIVIFLFWPALWVNPIDPITSLFKTSFGLLESTAGVPFEEISIQTILQKFSFDIYLNSLWWQASPLVYIGFLIGAIHLIIKCKPSKPYPRSKLRCIAGFALWDQVCQHIPSGLRPVEPPVPTIHPSSKLVGILAKGIKPNDKWKEWKITFISFVSLAGLMFLMMSVGEKTGSHYIMVTHVALSLLAGLGFYAGLESIKERIKPNKPKILSSAVLIILILILLVSALPYFPYYFDYSNPVSQVISGDIPIMNLAYAQGLDLAANYLSSKPDADQLTVLSWFSVSIDYLFPGDTMHIYINHSWSKYAVERLKSSDYLVLYYRYQAYREMPENIMGILENVKPEKAIIMHGIEMVRIYKVSDLPPAVFIPYTDK